MSDAFTEQAEQTLNHLETCSKCSHAKTEHDEDLGCLHDENDPSVSDADYDEGLVCQCNRRVRDGEWG